MASKSASLEYLNLQFFYGGIAPSSKIGSAGSFAMGKRLNILDEPSQITIMPATNKVSGSVVTDLIKWFVSGTPYNNYLYGYSETGNIYQQDNSGNWTLLYTVPNSCGQGMDIYEDYLYYASNTDVGRYGPLDNSPAFADNWGSSNALDYITGDPGTFIDTSVTKFAPVKVFGAGVAFGNGNQLGYYDVIQETFYSNQLTLTANAQIRCFEISDQFLVIGTWSGDNINANNQGSIYFWDGASDAPNNFVSVPQGGIDALLNNNNNLFSISGGNGQLLQNYSPVTVLQTLPGLPVGNYIEVFPGAVTNWRGVAMIGASANTDSASFVNGVYSYGALTQLYPSALNYSFTISTGTETGVRIGALYGQGNNLYIAWKDGNNYGVDLVVNNNAPYSTATLESLIFDNSELYKDKLAKKIKATHLPLRTGESVQIGYRINRAASYTLGTANSTVGSTETKLTIPEGRFREIQFIVILGGSGTSPTVTYIGMEYDQLLLETIF